MRLNHPLVHLFAEEPDRGRTVACGRGESPVSHAALLRDAGALVAALGSAPGQRWLVETEDPYRIAVALLAAAASGARIALPPNLQPGTLRELADGCARVLVDEGDFDASPARFDPLSPGRLVRAHDAPAAWKATPPSIDRDAPLVELFTSGTSGPGKKVTKALRHLEDEVVELERGFGESVARDAVVLATVSAHHLYGLLFRVLWPLSSSRPFSRDSVLLPDELLARVAETDRCVVVSSPAHLRHLAASPRLAEQAPRIGALFSSGGPLETRTALALEAALGFAPTEIFGSTETGGVASRRCSAADPSPRWTPFAPVRIAFDEGCLAVESPFVSAPEGSEARADERWRMGDRAEPDGEGFRLLGRSDRIAKVGEKTLSLPEIEEALAAHLFVEAAAAGTWAGRGGVRLGAVVVLNAAGRLALAEDGRRALAAQLSELLRERWARIALPRRWRFVDALPVDARGKVSSQALEEVLSRPAADVLEPLVLASSRDGDDHVFELVVPRDLAYLDGHYNAFPLVPGVVQIHWVMLAIGRIVAGGSARPAGSRRMEAIKFKNVMRPAQRFTMRLWPDAAGLRWNFVLGHDGRVFSSGRIALDA